MVGKLVRGKLEEFFNPGPAKGQTKSKDIEDSHDLYDHTK